MILAMQILGLIGLAIFIIAGIVWLVTTPRRPQVAVIALIGALIWAIATVIITLIALVP